jgi:hypothetical protein
MALQPSGEFVISAHARSEMGRRGVTEDVVRRVVASPDQELFVRGGRIVLQSRVEIGSPPKRYLVRVFIHIDRRPARVVTVYRTTKVDKYWRNEP